MRNKLVHFTSQVFCCCEFSYSQNNFKAASCNRVRPHSQSCSVSRAVPNLATLCCSIRTTLKLQLANFSHLIAVAGTFPDSGNKKHAIQSLLYILSVTAQQQRTSPSHWATNATFNLNGQLVSKHLAENVMAVLRFKQVESI